MSSSSDWITISEDSPENLRTVLAAESKRALAYLTKHRNYRYLEFLAQGGFGWVALMFDDMNSRQLAIKCSNVTTEMEVSWWPRLKHQNILPILEHITLENCSVFIMPAMRKDLWSVINQNGFYEQEFSFQLIRVWLQDVATALDYLHNQFLCHRDLKPDNVFLKNDGYACLGDFSLLGDVRKAYKGYFFLSIYEPADIKEFKEEVKRGSWQITPLLGGEKLDMWLLGICCIDLLTKMKVTKMRLTNCSEQQIWKFLEKILLQEDYLSDILKNRFRKGLFQPEDVACCQNFIQGLIQLEPNQRISASEARNHAFTNVEWPQLPNKFTLPKLAEEEIPERLPLPRDPCLKDDEVVMAEGREAGILSVASSKVPVEKDEKSDEGKTMIKKKTIMIKKPFYKPRKIKINAVMETNTPNKPTLLKRKPDESKE